jgi:diadenosine tetraphosphate (Ap4A) HIT family hydrolase
LAPDDPRPAFREKFRLDELTVHESEDWTLSVRPAQPVLGALVLSSRHLALDLSQVPSTSGDGLLDHLGRAERAAQARFGAVRCNVLCLMMQDPLVHFHLLPRYGEPPTFAGHEWPDSGWPGPPNLADSQALGDDELREILRAYASFDWR